FVFGAVQKSPVAEIRLTPPGFGASAGCQGVFAKSVAVGTGIRSIVTGHVPGRQEIAGLTRHALAQTGPRC
ncbi:hypothetical protein, partial [Cupriavidus taiwanensis]|uniref:hypothetical protein n=1 Tax=Cupriavidus taiwanensis TaxID=164546 RepID=UPI001F1193D9